MTRGASALTKAGVPIKRVDRCAMLSILQAFQASEDFTQLADSTRRSYVALIKRIILPST